VNFRNPLVRLVAAGVTSILVTVTPFVYYLHSLPVSSTNAEPWAHFGTYFGGVLGPLLGFLNLLVVVYIAVRVAELQQTNLAAKRLTLDLYNEWHGDALHQSRIALSEVVEKLKAAPALGLTLSELERSNSETSKHAFRIYHFFEKWALLAREGQIDTVLLGKVLGSYASWWNEVYFQPIGAHEKDQYMASTLALIEREVFANIKPQSTGSSNAQPGSQQDAAR